MLFLLGIWVSEVSFGILFYCLGFVYVLFLVFSFFFPLLLLGLFLVGVWG